MVLVEVVIELAVDLFPSQLVGSTESGVVKREDAFLTVTLMARPPITGSVQSVADFVVVRQRHQAIELGDESSRINSLAIRIPGSALHDGVGTIRSCRHVGQRSEDAGVSKLTRERRSIRIRRGL